jgi:hypothetical protein
MGTQNSGLSAQFGLLEELQAKMGTQMEYPSCSNVGVAFRAFCSSRRQRNMLSLYSNPKGEVVRNILGKTLGSLYIGKAVVGLAICGASLIFEPRNG